MLPEGTIAARDIWKRFRPDRRGKMLRLEYERLRAKLGGRPVDWRWALRDVTVVAEPGDSIGLVGNNGSGKSTLLKILCRVMDPYAGAVEVSGRVGALIEVRAGIDPDLTGRENIHLYGTLLGLRRAHVARRFDEIVEFAQLEAAIDRQVKFYSSGMQMRLGFAVAAYLEPDILLVDEVLAVGDAAFQQRCLERMRTVLSLGTTLIYVSHDLASVEAICTRGIWLRNGEIAAEGPMHETLSTYRAAIEHAAETIPFAADGVVRVSNVTVRNPEGGMLLTQETAEIAATFESEIVRSDTSVYLGVTEGTADPMFVFRRMASLGAGTTEVRCSIPHLPLPRGRYFVWLSVVQDRDGGVELFAWQPVGSFDVYGPDLDKTPKAVVRRAPVHVAATWEVGATNGSAGTVSEPVTVAGIPRADDADHESRAARGIAADG